MALPAGFLTGIAARRISADVWLEIEGIGWAFGIRDRSSSWFAGRSAAVERRLGIAGVMDGVPSGVDQEVRPLDGESTVGAYSATLLWDAAGVLQGLVANTGRQDYWLAMQPPAARAPSTTYALTDVVWHPDADGRELVVRCSIAGDSAAGSAAWASGKAVGDTITDGGATWTVLAVSRDIEEGDTVANVAYYGTADAAQYPAGGGTFYVGRETFTYTARTASANGGGWFSGVTRGMYPLPGRTAKAAHSVGDVISQYPRFLKTRGVAVVVTYDGTESGSVTRWAGSIENAKSALQGTAVTLSMESVNAAFISKAFWGQRTGKLAAGIANATGGYSPASTGEPAAETTRVRLVTPSLKGAWTVGATLIVRVEDEFFAGTIAVDATGTYVDFSDPGARGLFSSLVVAHPLGAMVQEVLWIGEYSSTGSAEQRFCKFTLGHHPLTVALCFILSRNGDGTNGTYDILPPGWGVGVDQAAINVTEIEQLRDQWLPSVKHAWPYFAPFELRDELVNLLKPLLCFSVPLLDDVLSIRRDNPVIPGEVRRVVGLSAILAPPEWDAALGDVVGSVTMRSDFNPIEDQHRQEYIEEFQGPGVEAQEFYRQGAQNLEIDARGQYSGNDAGAVGFFGSALATGIEETARRHFETIADRLARPYPAVQVECAWGELVNELGDVIQLTVPHVPNARTGGFGWTDELCQVRRKQPNDERGTVTLTVRQIPPTETRRIAPGEPVASTSAGVIKIADADGALFDASLFAAGDAIEVWTSDLLTSRGTATLTGVTDGGTTLDLAMATVPAGTVAGDVVMPASYDSATATQRGRWAFLADANLQLGSGNADAHLYAI